MRETGFVTHSEYQKHIRGEWRTIHDLWPHIRKYVPGFGYSKAEIDAMFAGTQGSVAFADATGFIAEDNANFFWDAMNLRLGIALAGAAPTARIDIVAEVAFPAINIAAGAAGEMSTPDGQQFRWGHWNEVDTFTERLKFDAAGLFYISYLSAASILFAGAGGEIKQDNANLRWDDGNNRLGVGCTPVVVLDVEGAGTVTGGTAYGGVVARFRTTDDKHISVSIDANTGKDPVLVLAENGSCIWDLRNDTSAPDAFQIRYQVGDVNRTDFQIDNAGNVEILTGYLGIRGNEELRFYDNGNYVGFEAPALDADQIWVLPAEDGDLGDALVTDGAGNLSWAAGGAADEKVKVDIGAVAGYLGAAFNDGVLRTGAPLTYADGGNFVTLGVDPSAIKLDDLGAPDDNADLDFSTAKHGLVPKGTDVGHFLKDDGTWAAGGGGGAVVFPDLTDTPANYVGAANKIVKVNATPDALEFGADIEDLEDVDTIVGQAGKYAKVKAGDAGIEWAAGEGGEGYGAEVIDEDFDALINGDIHGQGVYSGWGAWDTDTEDANCSAEIAANPGNGKMLILTDANAAGIVQTRLDADAGHEIVQCLFRCKMRISSLADTNKRGYIGIWDRLGTHTGIYFRDNFLKWYTGAAAVDLVAAVASTWYDVIVFMDCTALRAVIWVDGVLKLTAQGCTIQDIESFTFYTSSAGTGYTVDFDDLLIVDLTRKP